ncbi:MAG: adenylosuccinate lyase [Acidobacteria bacterium]|nr:adenylosuccinate lyase [Acidobacteriota bacterium]
MIPRYTTPEMEKIWSDENKFTKWLKVELAVLEVLAEQGKVSEEAVSTIRKKAVISPERIAEIEKETKHDVVAFIKSIEEVVGSDARFLHFGLTSSDVLDTSLALLMKEAGEVILAELERLSRVIKSKAFEHKHTVMIGRTHGVHAEPITLGLKFAWWYTELKRGTLRFRRAVDGISYGKISGAVGTFAHLPPEVEEKVMEKLGLSPEPISTQIIERDRHAEYLTSLAILASSFERFALEVRHLERTEVREMEEPFSRRQTGSSAMPHKRNPVACEQISGLARVVRANALASLENIPLWHERDISHSSVERIIIPDSTTLVHYLTRRLARVIEGLRIYPERMKENLYLTRGLIFSERLLLALIEKGLTRSEAYRLVQRRAMEAWEKGLDFFPLVSQDEEITSHLPPDELSQIFDLTSSLNYVDYIFRRVFGEE